MNIAFKPSKELLEELLLYISIKDLAQIIGIHKKTIEIYSKQYGIDAKDLRAKREFFGHRKIPAELLDRLKAEKRAYEGREPIKPLPVECLAVPKEIFNEPEPQKEVTTLKFDTCDIPSMIRSGNIMGWLYTPKRKQETPYYGKYTGVPNRRNSEGNGRPITGIKLA